MIAITNNMISNNSLITDVGIGILSPLCHMIKKLAITNVQNINMGEWNVMKTIKARMGKIQIMAKAEKPAVIKL
jgi:hypothetical protein